MKTINYNFTFTFDVTEMVNNMYPIYSSINASDRANMMKELELSEEDLGTGLVRTVSISISSDDIDTGSDHNPVADMFDNIQQGRFYYSDDYGYVEFMTVEVEATI